MFNKVKTKLTIIYTFSLVLMLLSFIGVLYFFISHEIDNSEEQVLQDYFVKEKKEFTEDIYNEDHHELKIETNKEIFYYIYKPGGKLLSGEETFSGFYQFLKTKGYLTNAEGLTEVNQGRKHFLIMIRPLAKDSFALLGMEITGQKHLVQNITWVLFVLTLLFSLILALIGYYFAGQAMKPIKRSFEKQEKFVSDASHELRTPLSIFYSSIDLLMREEKGRLSPTGLEVLMDVKEEAHLMHKLVNDLLLLARSDADQFVPEMKTINLSMLLTSICQRYSRTIQGGVLLEQKIETEIYLNCDEVKIQQLVYILLDNAFRYTKEGKVTLSLTLKGAEAIIKVRDTGPGIPLEELPYIFERFYRMDKTREKGGAGLGLAIAQAIVKAHRGAISAESSIGKGSVFTVIFNSGNRKRQS